VIAPLENLALRIEVPEGGLGSSEVMRKAVGGIGRGDEVPRG
jgi:hypothetical protein